MAANISGLTNWAKNNPDLAALLAGAGLQFGGTLYTNAKNSQNAALDRATGAAAGTPGIEGLLSLLQLANQGAANAGDLALSSGAADQRETMLQAMLGGKMSPAQISAPAYLQGFTGNLKMPSIDPAELKKLMDFSNARRAQTHSNIATLNPYTQGLEGTGELQRSLQGQRGALQNMFNTAAQSELAYGQQARGAAQNALGNTSSSGKSKASTIGNIMGIAGTLLPMLGGGLPNWLGPAISIGGGALAKNPLQMALGGLNWLTAPKTGATTSPAVSQLYQSAPGLQIPAKPSPYSQVRF